MEDYSYTQLEFYKFLYRLKGLTILEMKFIIWHYFNKLPHSKLAELDDKDFTRQRAHQIIRKALYKLKINLTNHIL